MLDGAAAAVNRRASTSRPPRLVPWLALAALLAGGAHAEPPSPVALWQDYDPRREPLGEEIFGRWSAGGVRFKEVSFDGDRCGDDRVRIYGIYAAPEEGRSRPAILHIHGGGQTVNDRWLAFWAGRGYAALSINWGGEWPGREKFTRYPPALHQGNHKQSSHTLRAPTMWDNSWMIWARVCRRGLTYLESQPEVDADRLGAFGVSMGGSLIWNLALDERLKAGCAIYGAGWDSYRHDEPKYAIPPVRRVPDAATQVWRRLAAPEAYAPLVRFPMLFLNSTNDQHGDMDRVLDSLAMIPDGVPRRQCITPRFRHHIGREFAGTLPAWMDHFLNDGPALPATPRVQLLVGEDRVPAIDVVPDGTRPVVGIDIWYALEHPYAVSRHWRLASSGTATRVAAPVMDAQGYLFAFANVRYAGDVTLSSELVAVIPAETGPARATLQPCPSLFGADQPDGGFVPSSYGTDPEPGSAAAIEYHPKSASFDGLRGVKPDPRSGLSTFKPTDPQFRAAADFTHLELLVHGREGCPFEVVLHESFYRPGQRTFRATIRLAANTGWQRIALTPGMFAKTGTASTPAAPETLESFTEVEVIDFKPPDDNATAWLQATPLIGEVGWTRRSPH